MTAPDFNPSEDWPDEPDNERLRAFARRLADARPTLPPEALERIGQAMRAEIGHAETRPLPKRPLQRLTAVAAAAGVLVAVGLWIAAGRNVAENGDRAAVVESAKPQPPVVEDRLHLALAMPSGINVPSGPLVRLDEYRSLIADTH
jgi:hypothetical protein